MGMKLLEWEWNYQNGNGTTGAGMGLSEWEQEYLLTFLQLPSPPVSWGRELLPWLLHSELSWLEQTHEPLAASA